MIARLTIPIMIQRHRGGDIPPTFLTLVFGLTPHFYSRLCSSRHNLNVRRSKSQIVQVSARQFNQCFFALSISYCILHQRKHHKSRYYKHNTCTDIDNFDPVRQFLGFHFYINYFFFGFHFSHLCYYSFTPL